MHDLCDRVTSVTNVTPVTLSHSMRPPDYLHIGVDGASHNQTFFFGGPESPAPRLPLSDPLGVGVAIDSPSEKFGTDKLSFHDLGREPIGECVIPTMACLAFRRVRL